MKKKGQQKGSQASTVIGIITLLIVFYILFLPPDDRAELLGTSIDDGSSGATGTSSQGTTSYDPGETLFTVNPGNIDYQNLDSYEYEIPSFNLYQTDNSAVLAQAGSLFVRNGWFDKVNRNFSFHIDDVDEVSDVSMSLTASRFFGKLRISINGKDLYDYQLTNANPDPIKVGKQFLKDGENVIQLSVSDVGMAFWKTNEYVIEDIKIVGTVADYSRSESETTFYITAEEGDNVESAALKFTPDCKTGDVGILNVELNNRNVFKGVPDCGLPNTHTISPSMLNIGKNKVVFKTEKGSYLIDRITVKTFLKEPVQPVYYFDLDDDLFYTSYKDINRCGEPDGVCPEDCDEDLDRDCCFEKYVGGYWCDVQTDYLDDRCVGQVDSGRCGTCKSGYEDKRGYAPDDCEEQCGDDHDGNSPVNCNIDYDKDCCFDRGGDQFWCNDLPTSGEDYTCVDSLTYDSCKLCPNGYDGEDSNPSCDYDSDDKDEVKLQDGVHIDIEFKFTEKGEDKEALFYINGYESGFDTREDYFRKRIDSYIEPGTNSLRLVPKSDLQIREIAIKLED